MALTRDEYISKYKNLAIDTTNGTGLFPSVMLAQGIVESNNGNSLLASKHHNHFGIKADKNWKGKRINSKTKEYVKGSAININDDFRSYGSDREGFKDRVKFLTSNPRYKSAGVFNAKTPKAQIEALKKAGYATDPKYVDIIQGVLDHEKLGILDTIKRHPLRTKAIIVLLLAGAGYFGYKYYKKHYGKL